MSRKCAVHACPNLIPSWDPHPQCVVHRSCSRSARCRSFCIGLSEAHFDALERGSCLGLRSKHVPVTSTNSGLTIASSGSSSGSEGKPRAPALTTVASSSGLTTVVEAGSLAVPSRSDLAGGSGLVISDHGALVSSPDQTGVAPGLTASDDQATAREKPGVASGLVTRGGMGASVPAVVVTAACSQAVVMPQGTVVTTVACTPVQAVGTSVLQTPVCTASVLAPVANQLGASSGLPSGLPGVGLAVRPPGLHGAVDQGNQPQGLAAHGQPRQQLPAWSLPLSGVPSLGQPAAVPGLGFPQLPYPVWQQGGGAEVAAAAAAVGLQGSTGIPLQGIPSVWSIPPWFQQPASQQIGYAGYGQPYTQLTTGPWSQVVPGGMSRTTQPPAQQRAPSTVSSSLPSTSGSRVNTSAPSASLAGPSSPQAVSSESDSSSDDESQEEGSLQVVANSPSESRGTSSETGTNPLPEGVVSLNPSLLESR